MEEEKLSKEEQILREFLQNPFNNGGVTLLVPYLSMLTLLSKAYSAGVRDERTRREEANPFKKPSHRFEELETRTEKVEA